MNKSILLSFFAFLAFQSILPVHATTRLFTYSYESKTLKAGEVEIEPWTTFRSGHQDYYLRMDQRIEIETGLTDRLQTAFYLNTTAKTEETPTGKVGSFEFDGVSSEWKYKFSDPAADALGFALYFEGTLSTHETEFEQKFIFDKDFGNWLIALNLTTEYAMDFENVATETALEFEASGGASYQFTDSFSAGLEIRNHNEFPEADHWEHSALFVGPALNYTNEKWWTTLTVLPQVVGFKGATEDNLVLGDLERFEVRLLLGFHI